MTQWLPPGTRPRGRIRGPAPSRPRESERLTAFTLVALAIVLLWVPLTTGLSFPSKLNEAVRHIPAVLSSVDHFPGLEEMRDAALPTLPLLHGALGQVARFTGAGVPELRAWMLILGLLAILVYGRVAASVPGNDWRTSALSFAAFPYFGATYFLVLTEGPGFLAVAVAVLWQIRYWESESNGALWLAGLAGAAACLVRQSLIVVPAVFAAAVLVRAVALGRVVATWRRLGWGGLLALALPAAALAFQVWLWRGFLPPFYQGLPGYYEPRLTVYLRSLLSVGANVGYYLLPATVAWAASRWRSVSRRAWPVMIAGSVGGTWYLHLSRHGGLVGTQGLFHLSADFLGHHIGAFAPLVLVALCLFSFSCVILVGLIRITRTPHFVPGAEFLLFVLLIGTFLVVGFGLATIPEQHIIVLYGLATLTFLATETWNANRVLWWGWAASVVFGVAHAIFYAVTVHGLVPEASGL